MRMRQLGAHGPDISVVGFGAWEMGAGPWGPNPEEDALHAALYAGIDAGMNWVDTAEVYGKGLSEEILGRALKGRGDVLVFTKVAPTPNGSGFRPEEVRAAVHGSLRRLQRERIDLYQLHWPDQNVDVQDTWGEMVSLVDEGLVRYIGVSNFDLALLERCRAVRHIDSVQPHFSMLIRRAADDVLPWCAEHGTGAITYGPLAFGLLTGAITMDTTFDDADWRSGKHGMGNYERLFAPEARARHLAVIERLRPVAERLGVTMAQLALAWNVAQVGVTGAIAGSRSASHTEQNARAGDVTLGDDDLAEIARSLES